MCSSALKDKHEQAQRILIGYLLGYPGMAHEILSTFPKEQAGAFTVPALRRIFEAVHDLHEKDAKISEQTVAAEFQPREWSTKGLPQVFMACSDAAAEEYQSKTLGETASDYVSAVLGGYHLSVMKEKARRATSFPDLVRMAEETIALDVGTVRDDEYAGEIGPILDEVIGLQEAISAGRREPGYSWGISELDESMLLRTGKLYTVAAQKGSGKTKFLLSVIHHNLKLQKAPVPTLLFSLEMDREEVGKMLLSRETEIDSSLIFTRTLAPELFEDIRAGRQILATSPLDIDCSPCLSVDQIVSRIRHWKTKYRIPDHTGIVGVDFLQLLSLDRERGQLSEATALKKTAFGLAGAAKRFRVCIIALAQLNKQGDNARPEIGFIEGSGGPAQASHGVLLLDLLRLRDRKQAASEDGWDKFDITVAKNRDGESEVTVHARADLSIGKFVGKETARVLPFRR